MPKQAMRQAWPLHWHRSEAEAVYRQFDDGTIEGLAKLIAAGLTPSPDIAVVGKLMQTLSGAVYRENGEWVRLHDRRLDMLRELHEAHDRPTLVFCNYRHEIERICQRFPFAVELEPVLIDAQRRAWGQYPVRL